MATGLATRVAHVAKNVVVAINPLSYVDVLIQTTEVFILKQHIEDLSLKVKLHLRPNRCLFFVSETVVKTNEAQFHEIPQAHVSYFIHTALAKNNEYSTLIGPPLSERARCFQRLEIRGETICPESGWKKT